MPEDDSPTPLSRFARAALVARRPAQRLEAILDDPHPAERVAATPVQDLYALVKELGLEEARELVALATPEQVQGFLDFEGWNGDHLDDAALVPWLEVLVGNDYEKLARVWRGLDTELTALLLARWTRIYNIVEEEMPDWEEPPFVPTPDRFFMLKITATDDETIRVIELLIDRLYRGDPELARHTIRAAASEPTTELLETAYRWRSGRMQDLGYAPMEEALIVYQPIDVASVTLGEATADQPIDPITLPSAYAAPVHKHFLGRALARVTDAAEATRLEASLVTLLNRVLAARSISPADTVAATEGAEAGAATLSLGLETVSRGDLARADEALRVISLVRLHRVGHSVTLQLGKLARVVAPRAGRAEEPYATVLTALMQPRPVFPRALERPPDLGTRPFSSVADVRVATQALAVLGAQVTLARDVLGGDPAALGAAVTLGDLGRTAIVHHLFGEPLSTAPLTVEHVRRFAASLQDGKLPAVARESIHAAIDGLREAKEIARPQECAAAIDGWIGDLEQELGSLATDQVPEKRFLKGLLLE